MVDIAPELLEKLQTDFADGVHNNTEIQRINALIQNRKGSYIDAEDFAKEIGKELSQTLGNNLSSMMLPDGKMYYNIADRTVRPLLESGYMLAAEEATAVQKVLNERAAIGLPVQNPGVDTERIDGIIQSISNAEQFDDIAWLLDAPLENLILSAVTNVARANFEFQGKAGLNPKIVRKAERKCCKWCSNLAGTYSYPVDNEDVFRRHQRCRCTVIYDQGDGFRENVHGKKKIIDTKEASIEARKLLGAKVADQRITGFSNQVVESLHNRVVTPEALQDVFSKPLKIQLKPDMVTTEIIGNKCTAYRTHADTAKLYKPKRK